MFVETIKFSNSLAFIVVIVRLCDYVPGNSLMDISQFVTVPGVEYFFYKKEPTDLLMPLEIKE